jgi:single-strand DNA-binding protein
VNVVTLIGNLATDIEVKDLGDDRKVANFLLAVDRPGPDSGAEFVPIAVWNKQAELCERFLGKGSRVAVDGRLRTRSWEAEDGQRRNAFEVVARSVQFLPGSGRDTEPTEAPPEERVAA